MNHHPLPMSRRASSTSLRYTALIWSLRLSAFWDVLTTFLGILLILEFQIKLIPIGTALVGTCIVFVFNLFTLVIWERWNTSRSNLPWPIVILTRLVWLMAILVDIWTSLTCNAWFIGDQSSLEQVNLFALMRLLTLDQRFIVIFVTFITAVSPMLLGYLRDRDLKML